MPAQRVAFGTSGHRGCSLDSSFNEAHILAITQAICLYRKQQNIDRPLYIGFDTHALSDPAFKSAMEVLAGNSIDVMIDAESSYTPTPVISHAILSYNRGLKSGLANGIVITPSHNGVTLDRERNAPMPMRLVPMTADVAFASSQPART